MPKDEWTLVDLMNYTHSVDVVIQRWADAVAEHLDYPEDVVGEIWGALILTRLMIDDLKVLNHNPQAEVISLLDGTQLITYFQTKNASNVKILCTCSFFGAMVYDPAQ